MPVGLDCGTAFLVKSEVDEVLQGVSFTPERNCFIEAASTEDTEETLRENKWLYAKHGDKFYILGEDAIKLKNLLSMRSNEENNNIVLTKIGQLRRPMKDGLLNTGEDKLAIAMIQKLIANLLGQPKHKNEHLCFCAPGDPINSSSSVLFHRSILSNFLSSLGYTVECIPEALAIIYSENPTAEDANSENGIAAFTGIACSFGGGMCNICFAFKKMPLINFSICNCGDWIDQESARVAGVETSVMTKFKEKNLNLDQIDMSDMRHAALNIFYESMIENAIKNFAAKFNELENQIDTPLEIVVAGGTASVPGFINKFKTVLHGVELPFNIKNVRLADNPLFTVANGCLAKAMATEKKSKQTKK